MESCGFEESTGKNPPSEEHLNCTLKSSGGGPPTQKKPEARPTGDDGHGSTDVAELLPGEVFDQAADQGAFPHFGGPDYYNYNWRGFQGSPVYKGDVVLFGLYVLGPKRKKKMATKSLLLLSMNYVK